MADAEDTVSMVGAAPRRMQSIDQFPWGRAALDFIGTGVEEHEALAERLGAVAAAEVLLLIVGQQCKNNERKFQEAINLGIPWEENHFTSLTALQQLCSDMSHRDLEEETEEGRGTSPATRPAQPSGTSSNTQRCITCAQVKPVPSFSNHQLKKKAKAKCAECVDKAG